jgi:hypothetical protein
MQPLSARELLRVWEQTFSQPAAERALVLLGTACPEMGPEVLSRLSLSERDRLLFNLRKQVFGTGLDAVSTCPDCGERVEVSLRTNEIVPESPAAAGEILSFRLDEYEIRLRLPNASDLIAARGLTSIHAIRNLLLERSILSSLRNGEAVSYRDLPAHVVDAVAERMSEADPLANIQLSLTCSRCSHSWLGALDISAFFWAEIQAWARRTLHEVHRLALAYGWSEAEILGMSAWRRHCYLSLIGK